MKFYIYFFTFLAFPVLGKSLPVENSSGDFSTIVPHIAEPLKIAVYPEHFELLQEAVDHGCSDFTTYDFHNRIKTELVLLCQALSHGGISPNLELIPIPSHARVIREMKEGNILMSSYTLWDAYYQPGNFYMSEALVPRGSFFKGIYTHPENKKLLSIKDVGQLKNFTGITNDGWKVDKKTIKCLELNMVNVDNQPTMMKMLQNKRVDYMLMQFTNHDDLSQRQFGTELIPVHNLKVVLNGSLHFLISRNYKNSNAIFNAIEKGLAKLHKNGALKEAYAVNGFYNPVVKDWNKIECLN